MSSPMNTIRERLVELGIEPKRSLGQNFLIEKTVIQRIIAAVQAAPKAAILEIGPGLGALTEDLRNLGQPLTLLELDEVFCKYWRDRGLEVVEGDALALSWEGFSNKGEICLVSNLPYQISSSLVVDRAIGPVNVRTMILMFQKEVAARIMAPFKTKDYGLLSVIAQVYFHIDKVSDASPQCFFPVPNVASRVLRFSRKDPAPQVEGRLFLSFVKRAFAQRRKKMVNNLKDVAEVPAAMERLGLSSNTRAEEVSPAQFVRLFQEVFTEHQDHRRK